MANEFWINPGDTFKASFGGAEAELFVMSKTILPNGGIQYTILSQPPQNSEGSSGIRPQPTGGSDVECDHDWQTINTRDLAGRTNSFERCSRCFESVID